jgi:lipopolysaccharide transport system ATP-binding protein
MPSSDTVISVRDLGKRYRIGAQQPAYRTLRDKLNDSLTAPFRRARHLITRNGNGHAAKNGRQFGAQSGVPAAQGNGNTIWALQDVSFDIKRGEVVGIIGRNGAGKSTLLKVLSRITEPTTGYADITGRLASLLEVGTGFHAELSGRENIFLNGSILGMRRAEIQAKFDEIVAFAEVEKFIDTPVKYYSSGMYVRLAFAVAAHLDPDILLVDEVLAVGDAAFRKKCLGKMDDVARHGRTVLFVSHDMTSVTLLCREAILFSNGRVADQGPSHRVIAEYLAEKNSDEPFVQWDPDSAPGDEVARLLRIEVSGNGDRRNNSFGLSEPIKISMKFEALRNKVRLNPVFVIHNQLGAQVFSTANYEEPQWGARYYEAGHFTTTCEVPAHLLNEGTYTVDAMLVQEMDTVRAQAEHAVCFAVFDDGVSRGDYVGQWVGIVRPRCQWQTRQC